MKVNGEHYRTIWLKKDNPEVLQIIDQRSLPFEFVIEDLVTVEDVAGAITEMHVRGAGLIGVTAGFGMYIATLKCSENNFDSDLKKFSEMLLETRPTAMNLRWAVERQLSTISEGGNPSEKIEIAKLTALEIADEDERFCRLIGEHGVGLIEKIAAEKSGTVNILTHCNAGWLAFADYGSATAPIYTAFEKGLDIHVWVDETRPRRQGARLTAWELNQHGVPHTIITDGTGGHLMQHGEVDLVIVGADRTTFTGDVANKIGTYQVALAAEDNNVPFYVAFPSSTFDWTIKDGVKEIPIERRDSSEVAYMPGEIDGKIVSVKIIPDGSKCVNYAFDVTPRRLITGLITERGICMADEDSVYELYPEKKQINI
jgi:methylthioribose-1-phosphate isomerase